MTEKDVMERLECTPVIAAVDGARFDAALKSPVDVIFLLDANIASVGEMIALAKKNNKSIFIHIDLAEGIGKDAAGIKWLKNLGADGIISTKASSVKLAKSEGLVTIQRFFLFDTKGVSSIDSQLDSTRPDFAELMPGVIPKIIEKFSNGACPIIAGGLVESKSEIMAALSSGAVAVSTGKPELWNI